MCQLSARAHSPPWYWLALALVLAGRGGAKGASVVTPLAARRSHLPRSKINTRAEPRRDGAGASTEARRSRGVGRVVSREDSSFLA